MLLRRTDGANDTAGRAPGSHAPISHGGVVGRAVPRVLMIANLFTLPYRALRTFSAAGAAVYVFGNHGARGFRFSRYCQGFAFAPRPFDGTFDEDMAAEVNRTIERFDIDLVFAGDQPSTRSLIGMRAALNAPSFPMPDLETFDLLNDKWSFFGLCQRLGVVCPPTRLVPDTASLRRALDAGSLTTPLVIKPTALDGSRGVVVIANPAERRLIDDLRYAPVLVQDFVPGVDIGASAYCRDGEVIAFVVHRLARATYATFAEATVRESITRIAGETKYNGIFNFDMRLAADGRVFFLECNPRVFYKMDLSMHAGVNFAAYGLDPTTTPAFVQGVNVRMPKAVLAAMPTPWRIARRDLAMAAHLYADPLSYVREALHIDWEDRSY